MKNMKVVKNENMKYWHTSKKYIVFPQKYRFSIPKLKNLLGQTPARFHRVPQTDYVFAVDLTIFKLTYMYRNASYFL